MRAKPKPPTSEIIWAYRTDHDCGLYTAKDAVEAQYRAELMVWLVAAVELLLEERATNSVEGQP